MTRRNVCKAIALAPAGALLSQQETVPVKLDPENLAATEFLRIGNRACRVFKTGDPLRIRDARVEAAQAFATMALFLTPEVKRQMEENIRSYECWWRNFERLPELGSKYGVELEAIAPDVQHRESAIAFLDAAGIDGFLNGFPQLLHPDRSRFEVPQTKSGSRFASTPSLAACGGGAYEDGFFAAAGVVASSLGVATFLGCIVCGPVAVGIGFGVSLLKLSRIMSCRYGVEMG